MKVITQFPMAQRLVGVAVLIMLGWWLRTLQPLHLSAAVAWPWASATVTLYFVDGPYLFPLSRRMPADVDLPRAALEALLAGPPTGGRLTSALPPGLAVRRVVVESGVAQVDLSGSAEALRKAPLGVPAILATLTRLPGVTSAAVTVDGTAVITSSTRAPLLYYPAAAGLVALPIAAANPQKALEAFLAGPASSALTRLPPDARLLGYDVEREGVVSLRFAYTPSVRALALERPDRMRFLLLGLIATLTSYPEVQAVRLDFGGQSRLGLGECSDLLRTPQPRPTLLNDERLLP